MSEDDWWKNWGGNTDDWAAGGGAAQWQWPPAEEAKPEGTKPAPVSKPKPIERVCASCGLIKSDGKFQDAEEQWWMCSLCISAYGVGDTGFYDGWKPKSQEAIDKASMWSSTLGDECIENDCWNLMVRDSEGWETWELEPFELKAKHAFMNPILEAEELTFYLYYRDIEDVETKRPVMLYLHGQGCCGDIHGVPCLNGEVSWLPDVPEEMLVLIPHLHTSKLVWVGAGVKGTLLHAMNMLVEEYGGDPDRLYVTGFSMGAIAAWELAADSVAGNAPFAAALIAGGLILDKSRIPTLTRFPIWLVHNVQDEFHRVDQNDLTAKTILVSSVQDGVVPRFRYSRITWPCARIGQHAGGAGGGFFAHHEVTQQAFNDPEIFEWLLSIRKDPDNALERNAKPNATTTLPNLPSSREDELETSERQQNALGILEKTLGLGGGLTEWDPASWDDSADWDPAYWENW